jgi:glycosyltransferase involved in cell wall biosynthesis
MISILLTVFKGEIYIRRALESIFNQTFKDFEILVIDEYGKDATEEIVKSYNNDKIRYFKKSDEGPGAAVRYGLKKCNYDFVAIFEQDDYWFKTKLEKQVKAFEDHPLIAIVSTDWCLGQTMPKQKKSSLIRYSYTDNSNPFECLLKENYIMASSVMLKKQIVEEVGFPDIKHITKGPWDRQLWLRITYKYPIRVLRDILIWKYKSPQTLFHSGNYCYLQYRGWLQALSYFSDAKPKYIDLIKNNIAQSALQTARFHLSNNEFYEYKKYIREALFYDKSYLIKKRDFLLQYLPAQLLRFLKNIRNKILYFRNPV